MQLCKCKWVAGLALLAMANAPDRAAAAPITGVVNGSFEQIAGADKLDPYLKDWNSFGLATSDDGVHWKEYGMIAKCREKTQMGSGHIWRKPEEY